LHSSFFNKLFGGEIMKVAVLGAGNGGQALAGYLSLKGFSVNLYNRSEKRIRHLKKNRGIQLRGLIKDFAPLSIITTSIKEAVRAVDLIMVVVPAHAHRFIAKICAPHLLEGQTIVLNPGRTGGALEFQNVLKEQGAKETVRIAEAQTFLFVSRVMGPHVNISGIKNSVPVAALPSSDTENVLAMLKKIHPSFERAENVLETSLNNIGAIFHPSTMIFNMGRIESKEAFGYYSDGITPQIARFLERLDNERRIVARSLHVSTLSTRDWLRTVYNAQGRSLYELIQDNGKYKGVGAPGSLLHRYILEDIPTGLVPMASLGHLLGVKTPVMNTIINIASEFYRTDFRHTGRTVESLKLKGMNKQQIIDYVNRGA
jgi:opine dehydrogenase